MLFGRRNGYIDVVTFLHFLFFRLPDDVQRIESETYLIRESTFTSITFPSCVQWEDITIRPTFVTHLLATFHATVAWVSIFFSLQKKHPSTRS